MILCEEYGRALFSLAEQEKQTKAYFDTLTALDALFSQNPQYAALLDTPALSKEEKHGLLAEAFDGQALLPNIRNFLTLLCDKHAVGQLSGCVRAYREFYYEAENIAEAVCTTAYPMREEQIAALHAKLEAISGKRVLLKTVTDPSVLGGIVLRMDGKQLDGSVRAQLDAFRRRLADAIL